MGIDIAHPSGWLTPFIKSYWGMETRIPEGRGHTQRIVPTGLPEMIFYFQDLPRSFDPGKSISENSLVSGQLKNYYDIEVKGSVSLFSIIFKPHGLMRFFDIPASEIANYNVPLRYLLKGVADKLEAQLYEAKTFASRKGIAEDFLFNLLKRNFRDFEFERIAFCISHISKTKGDVTIDSLAQKACLSRKQFERVFQDSVGTSPKRFLRTIRFQHAVDEKSKNQHLNFTELTYRCGYYDQSHMTSDFRKLAGMTPKEYFSNCDPYSDYFQ